MAVAAVAAVAAVPQVIEKTVEVPHILVHERIEEADGLLTVYQFCDRSSTPQVCAGSKSGVCELGEADPQNAGARGAKAGALHEML